VKEYDLFIPLYHNDGTPIDARKLRKLRIRLLQEFDGVTFFPQPNEGFWRLGKVVYRDEIVVFRVLTRKVRSARRFLAELKKELKRELKQEEILIVERDVDLL
jgi:hypothetical protein